LVDQAGFPQGAARELLEAGEAVLVLEVFGTGPSTNAAGSGARQPFKDFFTVYNRTDLQERVRDVVTACAFLRSHGQGRPIVLWGNGEAGTWVLLAAPVADAVVADAAALDWEADANWMRPERFLPGVRNIGGPLGAAALASPRPLLVRRLAPGADLALVKAAYVAAGAAQRLRLGEETGSTLEALQWLSVSRIGDGP
jgi:hypothetical protein